MQKNMQKDMQKDVSPPVNEIGRYLLVGVVNTAVGYGAIMGLQYGLGTSALAANAGGYAVGWVVSYLLNRSYTFRSNRPHAQSLPAFAVAAGICYAVNAGVLVLAMSVLGLPGAVAQAMALCSYTVSFYLLNRYVIFARAA